MIEGRGGGNDDTHNNDPMAAGIKAAPPNKPTTRAQNLPTTQGGLLQCVGGL